MKRRALLRATGAAVAGGTAALVGVSATDTARAETALSLDVVGDSATVGADETVTAVALDCTIEWAYDLPESAMPETVIVELAAGVDEPEVVDSADSAQLFTEADGEEEFDVDLLEEDVLSSDELTPEEGERETDVTVEARLRVEDGDGEALARETTDDVATVTIEHDDVDAAEFGEVGGSGSLTIETE